jgi:hypothetical protein
MRPAGSRGGASTPTVRSHATRRTPRPPSPHGWSTPRGRRTREPPRALRRRVRLVVGAHLEDGRREDRDVSLRHTVGAHLEDGRRDSRHALCGVAVRTTGIPRRVSPLGPAGHFARSMRRTRRGHGARRRMLARRSAASGTRARSSPASASTPSPDSARGGQSEGASRRAPVGGRRSEDASRRVPVGGCQSERASRRVPVGSVEASRWVMCAVA